MIAHRYVELITMFKKRSMHTLFVTMLLMLSVAIATPAQTYDAGLRARLGSVIDRAIKEKRIVGTVVLVSYDSHVVYPRAVGFADREE
jgi:hypothetical protein